jgi:hypothetical protein
MQIAFAVLPQKGTPPMRNIICSGLAVAFSLAVGAMPAIAASPYDGTWTAQRYTGCVGGQFALTVTDGVATVSKHPGQAVFHPAKIGSDGKVALYPTGWGRSDLPPLYVAFAGDHFEAHRNADCGYFTVTGVRTSQ